MDVNSPSNATSQPHQLQTLDVCHPYNYSAPQNILSINSPQIPPTDISPRILRPLTTLPRQNLNALSHPRHLQPSRVNSIPSAHQLLRQIPAPLSAHYAPAHTDSQLIQKLSFLQNHDPSMHVYQHLTESSCDPRGNLSIPRVNANNNHQSITHADHNNHSHFSN